MRKKQTILLTTMLLSGSLVASTAPAQADTGCETSPNGMPIYESIDGLEQWNIGGQNFWTAPGDATENLRSFATDFNNEVEPIGGDNDDDWSWSPDSQTQEGSCSNHTSGTAIDLNAEKHPMGEKGTFTPEQIDTIHSILQRYDGHIAWGGDWDTPIDEMHFEYIP